VHQCAGQDGGHLGAQAGGDLRRLAQQEVAGQDRHQVAPLGVGRRHPTAGVGIVHHVVVVQRAEVHELAGDPAQNELVRGGRAAGGAGGEGQRRPEALSAGPDEVAADLAQERVLGGHRSPQGDVDPVEVPVEIGKAQELGDVHLPRDGRGSPG